LNRVFDIFNIQVVLHLLTFINI